MDRFNLIIVLTLFSLISVYTLLVSNDDKTITKSTDKSFVYIHVPKTGRILYL